MDITSAETLFAVISGDISGKKLDDFMLIWTIVSICQKAALCGDYETVLYRPEWPMQFRNVTLPPSVVEWLRSKGYDVRYAHQREVMGLRNSDGVYPVVDFIPPPKSAAQVDQ